MILNDNASTTVNLSLVVTATRVLAGLAYGIRVNGVTLEYATAQAREADLKTITKWIARTEMRR